MQVDVVELPNALRDADLRDRCVVVFDVLRATTTIVAALSAGANEVRVFDSLDAARAGREPAALLAGETSCRKPQGSDLGNSPREFVADAVNGKCICMSTTNGTRAIVAAQRAAELYVAALVNARAMAKHLVARQRDVTLLCSGTGGVLAQEDVIGAGAVIDHLRHLVDLQLPDANALGAWNLYLQARSDLRGALRNTDGGDNVTAAGLEADIDFAAAMDSIDVVGEVLPDPLRVVKVNA